ncbi:hypothetical protein EV385_0549 [Krasilnikovia cinnamomea]|uniref:Uncharacterized protein n=1 Tax=Krasilnikovia cinnamomea TaxID=349313 RepID=A0A4Q7ZEV5_9ACTN|nr:hypothetical protein [Krasilnikovia cinnamomea]RZU48824.1 hypothetical protein EV385_0549 [Krasilnikovia cinnamomea]
MASLEDLERRIAALEEQVGLEAGLRASADRDLSGLAQTLRAQHHSIQAMAINQSQHNEKLDRHEESLAAAHGKLDRIITMLDRLIDQAGPDVSTP